MFRSLAAFSLLAIAMIANGQGCSDAGFCTMGAMKPDQSFNKKVEFKLRSMEVSFYRGRRNKSTSSPVVYVTTLDLNFNITKNTFLQVKLPYQAVNGSIGSTSGLSDLSLSLTQILRSTSKYDISLTVGGKIPSNKADISDPTRNKIDFPMIYQTSLGTYDFVAGISLKTRKWLFATGLQHPFNKTENTYNESNKLKRGTDVMLRVEKNFRFSRFNFSLGALSIFKITQDEIEDPDTELRKKLDGTTGMALTLIGTFGYSFNIRSGIRILLGQQVASQKVNIDGLTRNAVQTISYYYRF